MSATVSPRPALYGTLVWLAGATAIGLTGVLGTQRFGPPLLALALTIAAVFVSSRVAVVRESVDSLPLQALVGIHAVRFIGIVFLILGARGELSPLFAERAGWGDVTTAAIAVVLVLIGLAKVPRSVLLAWNTLGMLDLFVAVGTATFLVARGDVPGVQPLLSLPLILVPIFAVPLLFATHVALFRRLRAPTQ
ncbi:MAG TPA: hypothetical protein VFP26_05615 [Gemmatimonadaceae bacterium]|jgi:hypothetical protein|nr:hypothetical protein [Gemmatimonadaceae bacterium]